MKQKLLLLFPKKNVEGTKKDVEGKKKKDVEGTKKKGVEGKKKKDVERKKKSRKKMKESKIWRKNWQK